MSALSVMHIRFIISIAHWEVGLGEILSVHIDFLYLLGPRMTWVMQPAATKAGATVRDPEMSGVRIYSTQPWTMQLTQAYKFVISKAAV